MSISASSLSALVQAIRVLRTVLGNRELRRVELAFAGFNTAEWAVWIALLVYAYERGGTTAAGLVAVGLLVPSMLFAPLGAVLGDRYRPGRTLFWSYIAQAIGMGITATLLLSAAPALLIYAAAAVAATAVTVTRPTMGALTPGLARRPEELTSVNVVSSWIESISILIGPILAGLLLAISGPGWVYGVMAIVVATGAALVWTVPGPPPAGETEVREAAHIALSRAAGAIKGEPSARVLVAIVCAAFVALGALEVLYPQLAIDALEQSSSWAGYLNAAFGAGAAVAIVFTASLVGRQRLMPSMLLGVGLYAGAFTLLAAYQSVATALLLLALVGFGRVVVDVSGRTLLQRIAPADSLARVFGVVEALSMAALLIGSLLVTALVAVGGLSLALVGIGLVLPLVVLAFGRSLFDVDRDATVPVVEIGLLRSLPLFAPLPAPQLEAVARSLERTEVSKGTCVIRQDDEGDVFYVIADGAIEVTRNAVTLATLGRGEGFGEIALLETRPRTATCTAVTDATLFALQRDDFLSAVTSHPRSDDQARQLATVRLLEQDAADGVGPGG